MKEREKKHLQAVEQINYDRYYKKSNSPEEREEKFLQAVELLEYPIAKAKEHIEYCKLVYGNLEASFRFPDFFGFKRTISFVMGTRRGKDGMKEHFEERKMCVIAPYFLSGLRLDPKELEKERKKQNKKNKL